MTDSSLVLRRPFGYRPNDQEIAVSPLIREARDRQRRRRCRLALAALALAVGVALGLNHFATAGTTSRPASGRAGQPAPQPCLLLGQTEVAQLLGASVRSRASIGSSACVWSTETFGASTPANRTLRLRLVASTKAHFLASMNDRSAVRVAGVTSEYRTSTVGSAARIYVWRHGYFVSISAPGATSALETEEAVAGEIARRL